MKSPYTWNLLKGINQDILWLCIDACLFSGLIIAYEVGLVAKIKTELLNWQRKRYMEKNSAPGDDQTHLLDEDVAQEQKREKQHDVLRVEGLMKHFGALTAVNDLTFGVRNGECFGLLGINGAGKTTTFRMLTGDEIRTAGEAYLKGIGLTERRRDFLQLIGYCPQFDSIIEVLTGKEMLQLFGRLRGLEHDVVESEAEKWLRILAIRQYADKACGTYSGGNKRKLNLAMALMGSPPILFLDEPSTGVDPVARRKLWKVINSIQKNGQSVVLTSHR